MKTNHFVSIIIPTKNEENVIGKCLAAIQNLNTPADNYEVIVADNNSLDRTVEIAKQFNVRIVNIDSQRTNVSGSRNIGAKHAKGDILAFVDADCVVSKDWLNNALVHFDHEDTCLTGYKYAIPENSSSVAKSWDFIFENRGVKGVVAWIPAGNMFVSKKCFDSVVLTRGSRTWTFDIETRRPSPPSALVADASTGPDRVALTWSPSGSNDVVGYHVYQALASTGPWTRSNADVVTSATYFGADGLSGSTRYFFAVAAVDGSGNESVRSSAVAVTTNPVQNSGWPRVLQQWTSSSAVVAEIDGDGAREIFVGADRVYGWHANGSEVVDGDANLATDGVFSPLGQGFTAGLAAGDLDGDGLDEIVACAWDTRQVFAFNANGSVLAGWPRALVNSTYGIWATPTLADSTSMAAPEGSW